MRHLVSVTLLAALASAAACVAQQRDTTKENVVVPGGERPSALTSASRDGSVADAGDASSDAAAGCLPGVYDVDVDTGYGGALAVTGKVEFASIVAINRTVLMEIQPSTASTVTQFTVILTQPASRFTYRLRGLPPGAYLLSAQADAAGSSAVGELGDLDGYYPGTAAAPYLTRDEASAIRVTDQCRSGLDFGIGVRR